LNNLILEIQSLVESGKVSDSVKQKLAPLTEGEQWDLYNALAKLKTVQKS